MAALLVASSSLFSRFLGIFRDRILAGEFGAGDALDVYYAAFRIPDLIFNLLVLGALSAGFIPIFTGLISSNKEKVKDFLAGSEYAGAWKLANNALNILIISLAVLSILGIVFAGPIIRLITPGYDQEKASQIVMLTRIMFLSPVFLGISSIIGGILQSFKRFFIYSLAPIFYNIGIIIGALYLVPAMGFKGLAWGVVLGAFLHMLVQVPTLFHLGFRYRPKIDIKDENIKRIGVMMLPRTLSLSTTQINLLITTGFASTLASGSLAIMNFSNNLQSFPVGLFGLSFAIAAFPSFAAVAFDREKLVKHFSNTIRQILFFIVPSTVLMLTLRAQIIRVVLGSGQFSWQDTVLTIETLGYFTVSLFAQATIPLLVRIYYARRDSWTPFLIGIGTDLLNVALAYFMSRSMGVSGLALSFSISNITYFILLWLLLHNEIGYMDETKIITSTLKFMIAGIAAGFMAQGMKAVIEPIVNMDKFWGIASQGFAAAFSATLVYLAFCALLRSEEMDNFWASFKARLTWNKVKTDDRSEARGL